MRNIITILGMILIIIGITALIYKGYTYTTQEKIIDIGPVQVTAERPKTIYFSPYLAGFSLATGIILVVVGRLKK